MGEDVIGDLERNAWSIFSFMGRGPGGRVVDSPTRLVIESPVPRTPYNGVWRFFDEGDRPMQQQVEELLAPMVARGVSPVWIVHPTTDAGVREVLARLGMVSAEDVYGMYADLAEIARSRKPSTRARHTRPSVRGEGVRKRKCHRHRP